MSSPSSSSDSETNSDYTIDSDVSDYNSRDDGHSSESGPDDREVDFKSLHFCKTHQPGEMRRSCQDCSIALKVISDKRLISRLFANSGSTTLKDSPSSSGMKSRFKGRCDQVVPTMSLSEEMLDTAKDLLNKGKFTSKAAWNDVVKKHLVLPDHQHDALSGDLKSEDVFNKFRKDHRFKNIFKYQAEIRDCLKFYRIAERPVFSVVDILNSQLTLVRKFGEDIGLKYPESAPPRNGDVSVPRQTRTTANNLSFSSAADAMPIPVELFDSIDWARIRNDDKDKIIDAMEQYRVDMGKKFVSLYSSISDAINNMEDLMIFHFDLWSHCDASMKELLRSKLACLFRHDVRNEILSSLNSKPDKDGGIFGGTLWSCERPQSLHSGIPHNTNLSSKTLKILLFLGSKKFKSALSAATKNDSVMRKAVLPKRKSDQQEGSAWRRSGHSRRRSYSRSRSRSPSRSRTPPSSRKRGGYSRRGSGSSGYKKRKFYSRGRGSGSSDKKNKPVKTKGILLPGVLSMTFWILHC